MYKNEKEIKKWILEHTQELKTCQQSLASTGINIPRLRGLRLMATEEKISEDEIKEMADSAEVDAVEDLVRACPPWSVGSSCHSYCDQD